MDTRVQEGGGESFGDDVVSGITYNVPKLRRGRKCELSGAPMLGLATPHARACLLPVYHIAVNR